jgi:metal-sulfur cluster biosynthetic enzyme
MLESDVLETLKRVIDPEAGVNIVDLGLVYKVVPSEAEVKIIMTMTTQSCPMGEHLTEQAERVVRAKFPGVKSVEVELVWDPPWSPAMMSEAAKKQLGA